MCGSVFRQFPREPCCALPEYSRNLTSTLVRGAGAQKNHIGHAHDLKSIISGDVKGAGLGAHGGVSRSLLTGVFSLSRRALGSGRVAVCMTCP